MKLNKIVIIFLLIVVSSIESYAGTISPEMLIAHAGGSVKDKKLTNSLQALNANVEKGYVLFEVDFEWTSDNRLVLIHDWDYTLFRLFCLKNILMSDINDNIISAVPYGIKQQFAELLSCNRIPDFSSDIINELRNYILRTYNLKPTYKEFMQLKMKDNLKQLDVDELMNWMSKNKDKSVVTDVKNSNLKALAFIAKKYPQIISQIIPQIYSFDEYAKVKSLGYKKIILTLYKMYDPKIHDKIIKFALENCLFAITMPKDVAVNTKLASKLIDNNVNVYVHTVNAVDEFHLLKKLGIKGVYTDDLVPIIK